MCGVAGLIDPQGVDMETRLAAMTDTLRLRGPDGDGVWFDDAAEGRIGLTQTRLAIVDLSDAGRQPMVSACGRYVMVYNGEIYNAPELRAALGGDAPDWRGHSDSEALLEHWARRGAAATIDAAIGMFAIAVWDRRAKTLTLVRDRFGIKPLYYAARNRFFVFGSELKALVAAGGWARRIDRDALSAYLRFNYVPAPRTIYAGVEKLEPGCMLIRAADGALTHERYWDFLDIAATALQSPVDLSDAEAEDALDALIRDAVGRRMVADVPLGAFLSGGIDSSTVVAAMQAQSAAPVRTFTMGFPVDGYDESPYAAAVARHLGTDHTALEVTPQHALDVVPRLADWYDEPFADSSQIPTFLVSEIARKQVTVALSGDGGDELFAGYERHRWGEAIWRRTGAMPRPLAGALSAGLRLAPGGLLRAANAIAPRRLRVNDPATKARKLAKMLARGDRAGQYAMLVSAFDAPERIARGGQEPSGVLWDRAVQARLPQMTEYMQVVDALTYLPDDILTKVDRASMACSLEARVPLLDHRIAAFAMSLPRRMRRRDGQGKWLLRRVLGRYVPETLFERPKQGFGIPVDRWLRGPLRDWAEDLLRPDALEADGLLRAAPIRRLWDQHQKGAADRTVEIWTVLMLQAWRRRWGV